MKTATVAPRILNSLSPRMVAEWSGTVEVLGPYSAPGAMPGSVLCRNDMGETMAFRRVQLVMG